MPSSTASFDSNPYEGIQPLTSGPLISSPTLQTTTAQPSVTQRCKIAPGSTTSDYKWVPDPTINAFYPTLTSGLLIPSAALQTTTVQPSATQHCKITSGPKACNYKWVPNPTTNAFYPIQSSATQRCKITPGSKASDYKWLPDPTTNAFYPTKPWVVLKPTRSQCPSPPSSSSDDLPGGPGCLLQPEQQTSRKTMMLDSVHTPENSTANYPVDANNKSILIPQAPMMSYRTLQGGFEYPSRQQHRNIQKDTIAPSSDASESNKMPGPALNHLGSQQMTAVTPSNYSFGLERRNPPPRRPGLTRRLAYSFQQEARRLGESVEVEQRPGLPRAAPNPISSSQSQSGNQEADVGAERSPSFCKTASQTANSREHTDQNQIRNVVLKRVAKLPESSSSSQCQVQERRALANRQFKGSFDDILMLGLSTSYQARKNKLERTEKWLQIVQKTYLKYDVLGYDLIDAFAEHAKIAYSAVGHIPKDGRSLPPAELSSVALLVHLPLPPNGQIQTSLTSKLDMRDFISSAYHHHVPIHYHITAGLQYSVDGSATPDSQSSFEVSATSGSVSSCEDFTTDNLIDATKSMSPILEPSQFAATVTYTSARGDNSKLSDVCLSIITELKRSGTRIIVLVGTLRDLFPLECYMEVCSQVEGISLVVIEDLVTKPRSEERETLEKRTLWEAEFISSRLWNVQNLWSPGCYKLWRKLQYDVEWEDNHQPGCQSSKGFRKRVNSASTATISSRAKSIW